MLPPMIKSLFVALAAFSLVASCSKPRPAQLFGASDKLTADDYDDVLESWTRKDEIYDGLEHKLFVSATLHSPEFRRAFALAWPNVYGSGGQVTRRELVELTGEVERSHTFFLSVFTAENKWNDFDSADSIWRMTLRSGDVEVEPTAIFEIKKDANLTAVYPHIGRFDECYLVRFPMTDHQEKLIITSTSESATLRIASALGTATLDWNFIRPKD